jgi:Major Facilitator Superfamily
MFPLFRFATTVLDRHAMPPSPTRERRMLWTGQILSAAAQAGALVLALAWVISTGADTRSVGLVLASGLLSLAAFTRPAAILADRWSRRAMMIVPNLAMVAMVPLLGAFVPAGEWRAAALSVLAGAARASFDAAGAAIVHHHTDDGRTGGALVDLTRRHALGHLIGVACALPLAVLEGTTVAGLVTAGLWFLAAAVVFPLHPALDGPSQPRPSLAASMSHGIAEVAANRKPRLATVADLVSCGVGGAVGALAFPELIRTLGEVRAALAVSAGVILVLALRPALSRLARARVAPVMAGGLLALALASFALALVDRAAEAAAAYGVLLAGAAICAAAGRRARSGIRAELRAPMGLANGALAAAAGGAGAAFGGIAGTTLGIGGALVVTATATVGAGLLLGIVALRPTLARARA